MPMRDNMDALQMFFNLETAQVNVPFLIRVLPVKAGTIIKMIRTIFVTEQHVVSNIVSCLPVLQCVLLK